MEYSAPKWTFPTRTYDFGSLTSSFIRLNSAAPAWCLICSDWVGSPQDKQQEIFRFVSKAAGRTVSMGGGSVVVFRPRLLKCSFFYLNNPTHHTHSNSSWSTKGQNPLLGLHLALSMPFMSTSPSIVSKSPSRGLVGRISHQNKLRYLTKVSFCCWVYSVTFREKRMHLDRLA